MNGLRLGIREKIAALLLICMVPMLILGVLVYLDRVQTRRNLALGAQRDVARGLASNVETFIANAVHAERAAGAAVTSQPYPVNGIVELFAAIRSNDLSFLSLALALPDGRVEASDPPMDPLASIAKRPAFARVRAGADWTVGPPIQSDGRTEVEVVVGIREKSPLGEEGRLTAVVDATVDMSRLRTVLPTSIAPDTDGIIVDSAGRAVLRLRSQTQSTESFRTFAPVRDALEGRAADIDGYRDPQTGVRDLGAAVPIPSLGWAAVVLEPESSALESAHQAAVQELVWFLAYVAVGLVLAWVLGGELSAPILALARGARAIGRGEVGHRVALRRTDELGELGTAFDEMSAQLERHVSEMNALQGVSDAALSTVELGQLLPTLVQQIVSALRADGGVVWFVEEGTGDLVVRVESSGPPAGQARRVRAGQGVVGRVAASARTLVMSEPGVIATPDVHATVCVPLRVGGKVIGVIEVFSRQPREFRAGEVRLLETFADRVALAVDNAQAYERQLEIAGIIQQALHLPASVQLPGLAAVGRYAPSREVGGDFYAILPLGEGRIGLAVADVSGKGIPAATLSARVQYLLEAFAPDDHRPEAVLGQLNRVLSRSAGSGMFVSLFYGVFDPGAGTFAFTSAGHLPPFLLRVASGPPQPLETPGLLLGVDPSARYTASEVRIGPGDLLVLFTDGITEARNAQGEQFGDRRIEALLETLQERAPDEIADRVIDAVRTWTGTSPADDQALVVACVVPQAPQALPPTERAAVYHQA